MKRISFILIGLILSFSSLVSQVSQQKPCTINISNPSPNIISNTINSAPPGSVICVNPGHYYENSLVVHNGITLRFYDGVIVDITSDFLIYSDCAFESLGNAASKVYILFGVNSAMVTWGKSTCNHTIFSTIASGIRWQGVTLAGRGADGSTFECCDIYNVSYIGNGASAGFVVHEAHDVRVNYCKISDFTNYGSYATSGVYTSHGAIVYFFKTLVQNNSGLGILVHENASVVLGTGSPSGVSCDNGNNIITGNTTDGIHANWNSCFYASPPNSYNNISGNGGYNAVAWKDPANNNNSIIYATDNYWGNIPPNLPNVHISNVSVFINPALTCQPPAPRYSIGVIDDNNSVGIGMLNKITNISSIDGLLEKAIALLSSKNYVEALNVYKLIIETPELSSVHNIALTGISAICRAAQKDEKLGLDYKEIFAYLKAHTKDDEKAPISYKITYAGALSGLGLYDEAISEYETIAKSYPGTDHELRVLVGISYTYLFYKKDLSKALEILEKAEKVAKVVKKEDDLLVKFLRGKVDAEISNSVMDDADRALQTAIALLSSKNYVEALNVYKLIIETPELSSVHDIALVGISAICRAAQKDEKLGLDYKEIFAYLKAHTKDDENASISHKITYAGTLSGLGLYDEAISEFEELFKTATITDYNKQRILSWLQYIRSNLNGFGSKEKVEEILGKIADLEKKLNAVVSVDNPTDLPTDYSLSQNYPNPFNPTTTIQYSIPKDEFVKLAVYDITGKVVKELVNGHKTAGRYSVEFNAGNYSSGIYYYRLETSQYNSTQKMMLIK